MKTEQVRGGLSILAVAALGLFLAPGFAAGEEVSFDVSLSGAPGSGDPEGEGEGAVTIDSETNQVSWEFSHSNIAAPTAMHIHEGAAGESGGVVVPLTVDTDQEGNLVGLTGASADVVQAILAAPESYYVNIHNSEHPGGAIRGQLGN